MYSSYTRPRVVLKVYNYHYSISYLLLQTIVAIIVFALSSLYIFLYLKNQQRAGKGERPVTELRFEISQESLRG